MDIPQFWKNFGLVKELDVAGSFVFNGLKQFHEMESFYYESEVFEVLYNLSVGVERLLKICVILIEHDQVEDQDVFEQSLITHSHHELLQRIQANYDLNFTAPFNEFLDVLSKFYKTHRYGRYGIKSATQEDSEKKLLSRYFEKHLSMEIRDNFPIDITPIDRQMKEFLGRRVGKICESLYDVVRDEAMRLRIFTYEVRYFSKAAKIFLHKKYDFHDEEVLWKELLIFLTRSDESSGMLNFIKETEPLEFDIGLIKDYLGCFGSDTAKLKVLDELEHHYTGLENVGDRLDRLGVIGNPNVYFDMDDESEDE